MFNKKSLHAPVLKHTSSLTETSQVNSGSNTSGSYSVDRNIIQYKGKYLASAKGQGWLQEITKLPAYTHILIRIY